GEVGEGAAVRSRLRRGARACRRRHALGLRQRTHDRHIPHGVPDAPSTLSEIRMGTTNQILVLTAFAWVAAAVAAPDPAAYPHPRGYVAIRAPSRPVIDGRMDEAVWRDAPWTDDFADMADPAS